MRRGPLLWALTVLMAACASGDPSPSTSPGVATTAGAALAGGACPVTIPDGRFVPPQPFPPRPPIDELVWHGTPSLWTALSADGSYEPRKSVWWSTSFPGGAVEETPAITVGWRRLDGPAEQVDNQGLGTNAFTDADGWFMIAGIDPEIPGCWEVTASYKGATLSYVYLRT